MDIYFYIALAMILLVILWRMAAGFRKGFVRELLSLIALAIAGVSAYLVLGAIGSYFNREIGRLIQIVVILLVIGVVYKCIHLLFVSLKLVSKLPVIRGADKLLGALLGILEGSAIVCYTISWLKAWGLSVLDTMFRL